MPRTEDFLNGNVAYTSDGNQYISLNDGGGSSLPAIVPNQIGGLNGDLSLIINVKTNVDGASVLINGENQFIETPTQIQKLLSDVLLNSNKVISVEKNGYTTNEKYIINAVKNSQYFNGNYAPFGQAGTVPIQDLYSDTTPYVFHIQYFVNGIKQPFTFDHSSQVVTLEFNNLIANAESGPIIIKPTPEEQTYTLTISSDNSNEAVIIKNNNVKTLLVNGINTFNGKAGDVFSLSSADLLNYKITSIFGKSTAGIFYPLTAMGTDSLSTTITLDGDYNLSITTEKVTTNVITTPVITLNNESIDRTYNINTKSGIAIGFATTGNTTKVTAYVNNTPYTFTNLPDPTNVGIVIPETAFTKIGNYKIILVPTNTQGDGEPVNINYNVVDDVYVGIPDITNIKYPSKIMGPDYIGTDVSFDLNYTTVNTDFVNVYIGKGSSFFKLDSNGSHIMNLKSILNLSNGDYAEDDESISFQLRLIPHNISGYTEITGKEEIITIKFLKGKLTIPRATAINRILEAFESQFDNIEINTPDDTSKYLTHLVHLGDGNNKVITTWTGSNDSLILKLYEPLDTTIQPNQQVWISKLQSNPIIDTLNLIGVNESFCPPLQGPNFSLEPDNGIGYKVYDDLLASGSLTSTDLLNKYLQDQNIDTTKLNIEFTSGSEYLFNNFTNFSSAEERVNNFLYKIKLIESYQSKYTSLTGSANNGSVSALNDLNKASDSINEIKRKFDAFEYFLYYDVSSSMAYPKNTNNIPLPSTNNIVIGWSDSLIETASLYDSNNPNYLGNNLPEFISENYENEQFVTFLDMIGHHFDIVWTYINALNRNRNIGYTQSTGMMNDMIYNMLESFGWEGRKAFDSQFLWEYTFGTNKDGTQKYSMPLKNANEEVWRRILANLPYLLKNKGTGRAMKAIMACYGVPQSMLTIMEFGGPQDPSADGVTKFTYDDRTSALVMKQSSSLSIPWHVVSPTSNYPESIEFRIKPSSYGTYSLISGSNFGVNLIQTTGSFARLDIDLGMGTGSAYSYFLEPYSSASLQTYYMDQSIYYVSDADVVTGSLEFPVSLDYYSNILINRHDLGNNSSWYEVNYSTTDGHRIITYASMSIMATTDIWESGSFVNIGGNGFVGNIDEFRLWRVPLEISKFKNHSLFPDAINGNSYTASTVDLLYRLDFEYPKDRTLDNNIKNVSINTQYGENYAYAQNFYSASSYPYQYQPYDRTVTANVPSVGFGFSNKIRFEDIELISDLSYKVRATKKSFDRGPIDSSRLGLFLSPTKELNMDILKAFGDFNIDNYIGDPSDEYKENYSQLQTLREYYFERLDRNINEYIQLIKYIDKSLFDVLHDVAPARAKVSKGLLIEPHFLERSKTRWDKPTTEYNNIQADIVANENYQIESDVIGEDALLNATEVATFDFEYNNIEGNIIADETYTLVGTTPMYDGQIDYGFSGSLEASYPTYETAIQIPTGSSISAEVDAFAMTVVGMDANSLDIAGFGLYANCSGVGIQKKIDLHGNVVSSRVIVNLIEKSYTQNISTQISGYPKIGANPGDEVVYADIPITKYKYEVSIIPFVTASYGVPYQPSVGGTTISVTPLCGYYPTHHKFKNTLSEGLQRSFHKGSTQNASTTPDGLDPIQTFTTNPNILRVAKTGRGSGEPILEVN